jgi:hypothetical protein
MRDILFVCSLFPPFTGDVCDHVSNDFLLMINGGHSVGLLFKAPALEISFTQEDAYSQLDKPKRTDVLV